MVLKRIGQIIGLFSSVAIIFSIFLSYVNVGLFGISVFSMSLFDCNRTGAIVIGVLGLLAFITVYANKGILTSVLSLIILVGNIFFCIYISTGDSELDEDVKLINSMFGDVFEPGIGFLIILLGSILLFLAGVMINKGKHSEAEKKKDKIKS